MSPANPRRHNRDAGRPCCGMRIDWSAKLRSTFIVAKQMRKPLDWRAYPYPFLYGQIGTRHWFDPRLARLRATGAGARGFRADAGDFAAADDIQLVNYICSRTLPGPRHPCEPRRDPGDGGARRTPSGSSSSSCCVRAPHAVCENPCHPDMSASLRLSAPGSPSSCGQGRPAAARASARVDAVFVTPAIIRRPARRCRSSGGRPCSSGRLKDFIIVEGRLRVRDELSGAPFPCPQGLRPQRRVFYIGSFYQIAVSRPASWLCWWHRLP